MEEEDDRAPPKVMLSARGWAREDLAELLLLTWYGMESITGYNRHRGGVPRRGGEGREGLPVQNTRWGQLVRHKREFAERRRRQGLSTIPVGVLAVAVAAGGGTVAGLGASAGFVVVVAVVLGFFGFSLVNWRCPSCDAYLGQRLNPRECPSCGRVLRD